MFVYNENSKILYIEYFCNNLGQGPRTTFFESYLKQDCSFFHLCDLFVVEKNLGLILPLCVLLEDESSNPPVCPCMSLGPERSRL